MPEAFTTAVAAGLAVASVNAYFAWRDHDVWRAVRRFFAWTLAFVVAGLAAPSIARWLLANVF